MNCSSFRCRLRPPNIFFYKKGDVNVGNCRSFPLAINRLNWGSSDLFPSSTLIRSGIEAKPKPSKSDKDKTIWNHKEMTKNSLNTVCKN